MPSIEIDYMEYATDAAAAAAYVSSAVGGSIDVFRPSDIPTGLVGYWKFDNNANDSSASGYNLTAVNSPTYTANGNYWKDEYCAHTVAASSQYFTIANASCENLRFTGTHTQSFWIKFAAFISYEVPFDKGAQAGQLCYVNSSGQLIWITGNVTNANTYYFSLNKWTHVALVFKSGDRAETYIDGNLFETTTTIANPGANTDGFYIGGSAAGGQTTSADIKDFASWNVALTPLQIKSLALGVDHSSYAYRPSNVSTQPTHWWKLNEVSGNRADSVATNPLTLTDNNTVLSAGGYVEGVSASFDGSDYLSTNGFDFTGGVWTLRTRVYFDSVAATQFLFRCRTDASNFIELYTYQTGILEFCVTTGGSATVTVRSATAVVTGVWYDVVVRENGDTYDMWIDGVQVATVSDTDRALSYSDSTQFGSRAGAFGVDAKMEDVALWIGYALTDAEIKSLACALPIQRQGIVSYWKMDEASGNAVDSIGTNTGVETSGTIASATGKVGTARDLERGDTEYFECANSDSLDIVSDMFLCTWFKPETTGDENSEIFDKNSRGTGYGMYLGSGSGLGFYVAGTRAFDMGLLTSAVWYHFAGNYDGVNIKTWKGAVNMATEPFSTNPSDTTSVARIGYYSVANLYCDGLLDEMILAKRYFRPEEIKAVYLKGLNGKEATSSEIAPPSSALAVYSEAGIKTQGSYSLKGIAAASGSLNKTLTRTL